jgi:hypothetical protein
LAFGTGFVGGAGLDFAGAAVDVGVFVVVVIFVFF